MFYFFLTIAVVFGIWTIVSFWIAASGGSWWIREQGETLGCLYLVLTVVGIVGSIVSWIWRF
jgi:hypothetical protein